MAPRREHRQQADLGHASSAVAPAPAQASDARGMVTTPQRRLLNVPHFLIFLNPVYGKRHFQVCVQAPPRVGPFGAFGAVTLARTSHHKQQGPKQSES
jgi:hypothetical protein